MSRPAPHAFATPDRGPSFADRAAHRGELAEARRRGWTTPNGLRSAARTVANLGIFVGLEVVTLRLGGGWWRLATLPAQVIVVTGFYSAMHEATHNNLFRSRGLNRASAALWATLLGTNPGFYREMHFFHHRWVGAEGGESPRNYRTLGAMLAGIPRTGWQFLMMSVSTTVGSAVFGYYPRYSTPSRRIQLRGESRLALLLWATLTTAVLAAPWLRTGWLLPVVAFHVVGYAFVSWPEHYDLGYRDDPLQSARTILMPRPMRFVYWNNNFHAAHHLFPAVTWDNLPDFSATLPDHPKTTIGLFHARLLRDVVTGAHPAEPDHDPIPAEAPEPGMLALVRLGAAAPTAPDAG